VAQPKGFEDKVSLIWSIADILRGDFKPHEYGSIILPFVVLRRLECALESTKAAVIKQAASLSGKIANVEPVLRKASKHTFYNTSPLDLGKLLQDPTKIGANLSTYISAFSPSAAEVLEKYGFPEKVKKLDEQGLLYQIVSKFADVDLSETEVSNEAMGYIFEELLRKFSEMSNETAGEHYTPREVIRLMVNLLFVEDTKALTGEKPVRTLYDPACGTGGMLSVAQDYLHTLNPNIQLEVFGQELNPETWAVSRSDLMIKGQDPARITLGNSLTDSDGHAGAHFDYCISNPPYGVDWNKYAEKIRDEADRGAEGRYGAGLPRVSDGSFLFIQHMISKMKPVKDDPRTPQVIDGGTRIAIILSGSPLFSGQAGSGESEIRRWIIENDWLEGIVAMPDQMFYNTGIGTYVWIISNRKDSKSKGKVRLIDARGMGTKVRKTLGAKRKELTELAIEEITELYAGSFGKKSDPRIKVMRNEEFGFARLTIERPLRRVWRIDEETLDSAPVEIREKLMGVKHATYADQNELEVALAAVGLTGRQLTLALKAIAVTDPTAAPTVGKKGELQPDSELRDNENIELPAGFIELSDVKRAEVITKLAAEYLTREIHPYLPDAWIDHTKTKVGYEIPFTRLFYTFKPSRSVVEIREEIESLESQIQSLMRSLE